MKFNKKILIGLLTASCVVAGTFGLAACQGGNNEGHEPDVTVGANGNVFVDGKDTGIAANKPGESKTIDYVLQIGNKVYVYYTDGSHHEVPYVDTNLSLGDNEINLSTDVLASGVTYTFAPGQTGKYLINVTGDNAKVTINNTVVDGTYSVQLDGDNLDVEIKCATVDGKAGKYNINIGTVDELSLTYANTITLPQLGKTVYYTLNVDANDAGVYSFDVELSDFMTECTFAVNGTTSSIGGGWSTGFLANLKAGDNLIAVTSNLSADGSATLSMSSIPNGGNLTVGANNLALALADTFYAYTFTATEDGDYTVTVPAPTIGSFLSVANSKGETIACCFPETSTLDDSGENIVSAPFSVKANETVTLLVKADCSFGDELEASYNLTIAKYTESLPIVHVSEDSSYDIEDEESFNEKYTEINVTEDGTKVLLDVETAGKYIVTVEYSRLANNASVTLNGHTFSSDDKTTLTLELDLTAGENEVTFETESEITIWVNLTAKS